MWKKSKKLKNDSQQKQLPARPVSLSEVKDAVRRYSAELASEIPLQVIINSDRTIDYQLLAPYLEAKPQQTYYMSRETYEIFEEKDKQLAEDLDKVQQAVDHYREQTGKLPITEGDPDKQVNYLKLEKLGLLSNRPDRPFFITEEEDMVTHRQP
ncbi:DUF3939 domain-containing protein [Sediminibacillus halophilus]|uniref:DUF3939 domain-containing protein n=1 Tax=Sediminibacillus halophilus TaxID=482461 RepID=A0A1G9PLQ8_9BACI|nr:DUF3939 domain-containing protein [Sediminibacillus halophilus]SDL99720.1 Protein of unknown function [Sediminibacillus halophilus]